MNVTIQDIADLIRRMTEEQRDELAAELSAAPLPRARVRCPSSCIGEGECRSRCLREEDHPLPHIDACGHEWLIGLKCRIGASEPTGPAVCSRLHGHEPPCRPVALVEARSTLPTRGPVPERRWGLCACGATRKEHAERGAGGCERTACAKYRK